MQTTKLTKKEIVTIVDARIREAHVTREDFSELKGIVKELGVRVNELGGRVNELGGRVSELGGKVGELAEAQKRTENRIAELAEAQKKTEDTVAELAGEMKVLAVGLDRNREEVGGLSRSFSYAFENETYRMLPAILKEKYGIEIKEKFIRADIGGKEINIFGRAEKEEKDIIIVGEAKLRLDERREKKRGEKDILEELEEKVESVREEYKESEIIRILVTHYATKGFLKKAKEKGIIVIQSFEW